MRQRWNDKCLFHNNFIACSKGFLGVNSECGIAQSTRGHIHRKSTPMIHYISSMVTRSCLMTAHKWPRHDRHKLSNIWIKSIAKPDLKVNKVACLFKSLHCMCWWTCWTNMQISCVFMLWIVVFLQYHLAHAKGEQFEGGASQRDYYVIAFYSWLIFICHVGSLYRNCHRNTL